MDKLFNFMGAWMSIYGGILIVGQLLSSWIGAPYLITALLFFAYAVGLIVWSRKKGDGIARYKITKPCLPSLEKMQPPTSATPEPVPTPSDLKVGTEQEEEEAPPKRERTPRLMNWVMLLPLLLFPVCNLLAIERDWNVFILLFVIGVSLVEELFFRGYFLSFFRNRRVGIWVSSVAFGLFHLINLSACVGVGYVILQVISGFAVGLCFCGVNEHYDSLLPSTILHALINATGVGVTNLVWWQVVATFACSALYVFFAWLLIYKKGRI